MPGIGIGVGLGLGHSTGGGWFNAPEFADFAAIADFNRDRYAITTVPLANIATASVAELCVKRACSFAEWFAFVASSTTASGDVAPYLPSFITGLCSRCGPSWTGLQTRWG